MAIGDLISNTDYNTIRNKIINVMATGSGNSGYGQNTFSLAVAEGNTITKAQWDALRYDIYNALVHQTGAAPTIAAISTGDVIRYGASNPNTQYSTLSDTATTNRFDLGSGQFVTDALGSQSTSTSWYQSRSLTATVTFNTAEQARFFFNAGGKIRFTSTRTGGSSAQQNTDWSNLLAAAGTQSFGGSVPAINFFNLTSAYQQFFTRSSSSPYASNNYKLEALCNVANNSAGTANVITFRITWTDGYYDPLVSDSPPPGDLVDGTLALTMDAVRAYGVLQPTATAGSFVTVGPATTVIDPFTGS